MDYLYNLLRAIDQLLNALLAGNSRQTISARAYEAAVVAHRPLWAVPYHGINAVAYSLRWFLARPLGYHWGEDMPKNHCENAYIDDPADRTYPQVTP